jgi:hypothetical protein
VRSRRRKLQGEKSAGVSSCSSSSSMRPTLAQQHEPLTHNSRMDVLLHKMPKARQTTSCADTASPYRP